VTVLRRAADAALLAELESADVADLLATGWRFPETFHAPGRDGRTDIWGVLFRPSNLNEQARYPVIESIYAGSQGSAVPVGFQVVRNQQVLAELGFVVVQLDGMGMSGRSKAFHDVAWQNLGDSGFPTGIAWIQALARQDPYLERQPGRNLRRLGRRLPCRPGAVAAPDGYSVAVAISGNHDHRTDKLWWTSCEWGIRLAALRGAVERRAGGPVEGAAAVARRRVGR